MKSTEFSLIRHYLGKTQEHIARALCVSTKTIQAYEEGRRAITPNSEKQMYLLMALKYRAGQPNRKQCWEIKNCPEEWRTVCTAWEYQAGDLCWFINGTRCGGNLKTTWKDKIHHCRKCEVFGSIIPSLIPGAE